MDLASSLHRHFGFSSFRAGQQESIQAILTGQHTLVVMPTGAGKSLIFQLAGLELSGITLVVSPLIALMKDQVDSLERRNIPATFINSTLPGPELNSRLRNVALNKYRFIYVAPERLRNTRFLEILKSQTISLLAVDEAHCISEWGHDFRPDYLHIAQARASLGNPLTVALTATATPQVQDDIVRLLGLGNTRRIVTGFNRPNLTLDIQYVSGTSAKLRALRKLVSSADPGATIIYTGTRRDAEEVTEFVQEVIRIPAQFYHAGSAAEERARIQSEFISGRLNVICATNAFGMGIDRADVRQVIHFSMPGSLEAYYQEAGRAGRDGLPARATLIYDPEDRALQEFFISNSALAERDLRAIYDALRKGNREWTTGDELSRLTGLHPVQLKVGLSELERAGVFQHLGDEGYRIHFKTQPWNQDGIEKAILHNRDHLRNRQVQLDRISHYAEANSCRRKIVLDHFGDKSKPEAEDCCDNCRSSKSAAHPAEQADARPHGDDPALTILDCVKAARVKVGREKLVQILRGSSAKDITRLRYDRNEHYGKLASLRRRAVGEMIDQLIELGYLKVIGGTYPVISLTPSGENAIKRGESIALQKSGGSRAARSQIATTRVVEPGRTKSLDAVSLLVKALESPDGNARRLAASALGRIGDPAAVEALLGLLECEEKPQVRQYSVTALGKIGDERAKGLLQQIAASEEEMYYTRDAARLALQRMGRIDNRPQMISHETQKTDPSRAAPAGDEVESFLQKPHPCALPGPWQAGWSLGFHSRMAGASWSRSGTGDLTYRLKYEADTTVLPALAEQAMDLLRSHPELGRVDLIVPVPCSTQRKVDPVRAFCDEWAGRIKIPVQTLVTKTRKTQPQKEMKTMAQKRDNVAEAFSVDREARDKRILLVDDLFDSGATLVEITRSLLSQNARGVNVLTLTRTIHSDT